MATKWLPLSSLFSCIFRVVTAPLAIGAVFVLMVFVLMVFRPPVIASQCDRDH